MDAILDRSCRRLVLDEQLSQDDAQVILGPIGFIDWRDAHRSLLRTAVTAYEREQMADLLPALLSALGEAADPDRVLSNFERFVTGVPDRLVLFNTFVDNPRAIEILVTLFAGSQFLTEILLRNPEYFDRLIDRKYLAHPKSVEDYTDQAHEILATEPDWEAQLDTLRRFQRQEMLRIGAGDLFDLLDLSTVTSQLSHLADSQIGLCLEIVAGKTGIPADDFAVISMGKLGGEELNYSSDIDLVFIAARDATRYRRLGEYLVQALSKVTGEGFIYRVDMRLRPWGKDGMLVSSLDGYVTYLQQHARLWEKQALLKARAVAGNLSLGNMFVEQSGSALFDLTEQAVRADILAMKQRTEAYLRNQGREWGEVKLGVGSIRDIEFVTQYLQLAHGADHPAIRSRNTLDGLNRLFEAGFLSADEYRVLADGYVFLRTIEHHLQMMDYRQTSTLPGNEQAIFHLARRLGFRGQAAGEEFLARYQQHCQAIRSVYRSFLEGSEMTKPSGTTSPQLNPHDVDDHLTRMDPAYGTTFGPEEVKRHAVLAEQINDEHLVEVDAVPLEDGCWKITIVGYDYLGVLSLICGMLVVYGFSIIDGNIFTYEAPSKTDRGGTRDTASSTKRTRTSSRLSAKTHQPGTSRRLRQKIVDVFTVRPVRGEVTLDVWIRFRDDLAELMQLMQIDQRRKARGELAKRVAAVMREMHEATTTLYPVYIKIDNDSSDRYTILDIDAPDTVGFLYELANALAINRVYISQMRISSVGNRVKDTLYVTDPQRNKITSPKKQRELRTAIVLVKHFTHLLPSSPNPETALLHFREFLTRLFENPNWPDELASLERHEVLDALARLLGVSEFLWDDFLRMQYVNLFPVVRDVDDLSTPKSRERQLATLQAGLQATTDAEERRETLNAFKDREMFRIDMRHILGHIPEFGQFSSELTDLAEVVVESAYYLCDEELRNRYGVPCLADGRPCPMSVCALGKCGGRELGFASDIELMFIFGGNGKTSGPHVISTAEFFEKLVQSFLSTIRARQEGIFEIDLQLRPYGKSGSMAVSLDAFQRYFAPDGEAWAYERQALIKLRPVAGSTRFGRQIVALRDEFVYEAGPFDVAAMQAMRERQIRHLVTGGTLNAKYSPGGMVDVEYIVQGLQINYGRQDASLRLTNTGQAMAALASAGILSSEDYTELREALVFLRRLVNALRMVRGNARDLTVPDAASEEFLFLARRLGYGADTNGLHNDLIQHTTRVQQLRKDLLG